ncbi:protease inhibitor I42 family protein [Methanobacterium sp. ACI-7]|uniref:protease inhibitor I42 family protein n=1 Tax=unclassified Methanobacterium TaxID=2627676 RepID=UPI0039C24B98
MKIQKIASMLILTVFALSMTSGVFAEDKCTTQDNINNLEEKQLTLKVNSKFSVKIESNPSTGYTWIPEYDLDSLKLIKSKYIPPKIDNLTVGAPGTQKFVFKALKTGETDITMKHIRPWDNSIPQKIVIYHVKIID